MCGRYTVARIDRLIGAFPKYRFPSDARPQYNIAPTRPVLALPNHGTDAVEWMRWGLIPSWTREGDRSGAPMFNARIETLAERAAWKVPLRERRCLIFADGFYEWRRTGAAKEPLYFRLRDGQPFAFAGLWDRWHPRTGPPVDSCAIITGAPNELVAEVHDRMPVIIHPEAFDQWLQPGERDAAPLLELLAPYPSDAMESYHVSSRVGSVKNDDADLVAKL